MGSERRRHARRQYAHHVLCYVDGWRIDAFTLDLSLGGTFLATDHAGRISPGALVGAVINSEEPIARRVYLFGKVVRVQTGDMPGLGLQWVRAASVDAVEPLVRVLGELFGLTPEQVTPRVTAGTGRQRYVFPFEAPAAELQQPDVVPSRRRSDAPSGAAPSDWPPEPHVAVGIDALLEVRGVRMASRVVRLGSRSLELDSSFVPGDEPGELILDLRLPVKNLDVPLRCTCRVIGATPPVAGRARLRLAVDRVDEGKFPKALEQFVKWAGSRAAAQA